MVKAGLKVKADVILKCVNRLNFIAETFRKTGGVHVAAIYRSNGELLVFAEDVGRHNAVDKVIGSAALDKSDFGVCFLALSGRLSGDIVLKAARVGLPILASLSAALDSGVEIAGSTDVTLIGFVRVNHMNIYTSEERISL
jgi:formate dehydrogenase accessory protein FdhD